VSNRRLSTGKIPYANAVDVADWQDLQAVPRHAAAGAGDKWRGNRESFRQADQFFQDITEAQRADLPRYKGDFLLIQHSAGSLTSQAYHKRMILRNEQLADAAEKASVAAAWMGGRPYPQQRLNDAWNLELAGHFHDLAAHFLALSAPDRYLRFGWEMNDAAWERALRQATRLPYVVQEKVEPAKNVFPVRSDSGFEFRDMRVDVYPQAYLGRILSCSSWLSWGSTAGFSTSAGLAPTFILEGAK